MEQNSSQPLRIVVHIGLHKTATRFFQNFVFAQLSGVGVMYNPPEVMALLHAIYKSPGDPSKIEQLEHLLSRYRADFPGQCLLISKPDIPGEMYDAYPEFEDNLQLLYRLMPEAQLLYVCRHPADWLHSAYRQSLVKGAAGPIETFQNFRNGSFGAKQSVFANGMRNLPALAFPVSEIDQAGAAIFGREQVTTLCFEHVRENKERVLELLRELLGLAALPELEPDRVKNRSFSARAIQRFCQGDRIDHTPQQSDAGPGPRLWKWWLKPRRKLRANFIKHVYDKRRYDDWDLLERHDMREQLMAHYDPQYQPLITASAHRLGLD